MAVRRRPAVLVAAAAAAVAVVAAAAAAHLRQIAAAMRGEAIALFQQQRPKRAEVPRTKRVLLQEVEVVVVEVVLREGVGKEAEAGSGLW